MSDFSLIFLVGFIILQPIIVFVLWRKKSPLKVDLTLHIFMDGKEVKQETLILETKEFNNGTSEPEF